MGENSKFINDLNNYGKGLQETLNKSGERLNATLKPYLHNSAYENGIDNIIHNVAILSTVSVNLASLVNALITEIVKVDGDIKNSSIATRLLGRMMICCSAIDQISDGAIEVQTIIPPSGDDNSTSATSNVHNISDYVN